MRQFGYVNNTFINLYSEDNVILEVGETCYFMFNNLDDIHRPIIGKGIIINDFFTEDLDKIYYVQLIEIIETPNILSKFITNKQFELHSYKDEKITKLGRLVQLSMALLGSDNNFFQKNLFKVDSFFIRQNIEKIISLRNEYIMVIKKDLEKQLQEINEIF